MPNIKFIEPSEVLHCNYNGEIGKVVATADLWVYNAKNLCVSFFYHVTSIFHLRGGKRKEKFFWAFLVVNDDIARYKIFF